MSEKGPSGTAAGWELLDQPSTKRSDEERLPTLAEHMRLVVCSGPDRGLELALTEGRCVVGKSRLCDLKLSDPEVSREHLEVTVLPSGIHVRDLGSMNGLYFHGARVEQVTVGVGARLVLGGTELQIALRGGAAAFPPSEAEHFGALWGRSLPMRQLFSLLERVAPTETHVLITGETGAGKEVCARAIHDASPRRKGPFVVCDVSTIARSLIESELFGHVRGAFTGAERDRVGAFAQAQGGTILLDEIGELDLELQPRLLRAIEQLQIKPLGASTYQQVDVRVLSATNRNLQEEVVAGRFRQDLLFRLSVITALLPPLRDRQEDVPCLVEKLLAERGYKVSAQALAVLAGYEWPGNVRELRNVLERAIALSGGATTLTAEMIGLEGVEASPLLPGADDEQFHTAKEKLVSRWERQYVAKLLERAHGNVSAAAREGGIARVYLYRLLKKYGIRGEE